MKQAQRHVIDLLRTDWLQTLQRTKTRSSEHMFYCIGTVHTANSSSSRDVNTL